jgi:protein AaeX
MNYAEINVFGVYISPIAPMIVTAWLLLWVLRRLPGSRRLFHHVWHPALFVFAIYVTLLAAIVLFAKGLFV